MRVTCTLLILLYSLSLMAQSSNSLNFCDSFYKVYVNGCENRSASNVAGGSFPLLFDAFNYSPANLPTYVAPYGIEYFQGQNESNFALIKGTKNVGLGASTRSTKNTFFSEVENYEIALKNSINNYTSTQTDNFKNFGTAFNILNLPNKLTMPLGLALKSNAAKGTTSIVYGLSMRTENLNLSYSYNKETPNQYQTSYYTLDEIITTHRYTAGLKYRGLMADYAIIKQISDKTYTNAGGSYGYYVTNGSYEVTTRIFSATWQYGNFNFTYGQRSQDDSRFNGQQSYLQSINYEKTHHMYGMRVDFGSHVHIGLYHNYVIDEDFSLLAQLMF